MEFLTHAYEAAQRTLRVRYLKVGCVLMALLTLSGVSLDRLDYLKSPAPLFKVRLAGATVAMVIFAVCFSKKIERYIQLVGMFWAIVSQATICVMILMTDGASSPYYAGLNLLTLGVAVLLPWTFLETLTICLLTMAMYIAACFLNP